MGQLLIVLAFTILSIVITKMWCTSPIYAQNCYSWNRYSNVLKNISFTRLFICVIIFFCSSFNVKCQKVKFYSTMGMNAFSVGSIGVIIFFFRLKTMGVEKHPQPQMSCLYMSINNANIFLRFKKGVGSVVTLNRN